MKHLRIIAAAWLAVVGLLGVGTLFVAPTPAFAACPYTGNTSGVDSSAMLNALNDICASTAGATPAGSAIIGKVGIDQTTPGTTNGVVLNSGSLTSSGYSCSMTFTPAASSHTAGDANGAAATCATIGPSGKEVIITSGTLEIDGASVEATAWRLYLYSVTPPSVIADDAAWDLPSGDRASYLGYVDLGTAVDLGSTQWVQNHILNQQVKLAGTSLFGYLVNLTTVSTAAVAHIVTLHTVAP